MMEGAVADVLQHVPPGAHEGRHADPLGSLAAHLGQPYDITNRLGLHHQHQGMAAYPAPHQRALGNLR